MKCSVKHEENTISVTFGEGPWAHPISFTYGEGKPYPDVHHAAEAARMVLKGGEVAIEMMRIETEIKLEGGFDAHQALYAFRGIR